MACSTVLGPLETERLVLRPSRADDAATFRRLWTERDPRVPEHRRIGADGRPTVRDIAASLAAADPDAAGPRLLTVERRDAAGVVGYCGLNARAQGAPDEPELAYELLRSVHGHGYATEAARAVVAWADEAGCPRLWAGVWDWNLASRRVLDKLGFVEVDQPGPVSVHGRSLMTVREP